jgi:Nitric oxide reductase activation protein
MYSAVSEIPGKWHNVYLPYSNQLKKGKETFPVFQPGIVLGEDFKKSRRLIKGLRIGNDSIWQEIFFELVKEIKFREKIIEKLMQATRNLNFSNVMFPNCDYASFFRMHAELSPDIRKITERVRLVKNAFDENTFQEFGNIDLQLAIQAIASQSGRNDIFARDEELMKDETWSILIDSSKSLSGSSNELRAIGICLAETAHSILGSSPWGMFAFSDELHCIKDFTEKYDNLIKARIGGLKMSGLSHIPDAIRACANLVKPHSKDRNFMILVSDGVPSGYSKIEEEFGVSVKELSHQGISLIAIGIGSGSLKKTVRTARIVEKPTDIAKEFMSVYMGMSS